MDNTVLTAIIAFTGVIISTIITMIINNRNNRINIGKAYKDVEQDYARELIKKRIEVYPLMYEELSTFIKIIQVRNKITFQDLDVFFDKFSILISKISIFYSSETGSTSYGLWKFIKSKVASLSEGQVIENHEELREMRKEIQKLEICLKKDLGVYIVEFNDGEKKVRLTPNYSEITEKVDQFNQNNKK